MIQNNSSSNYENSDEDIDLRQLFEALWTQKALIVIFVALSWFIALIYANSLPNLYTSKTLLRATQQEGGSVFSGASRLAALAGISLPSASGSTVTEAVAVLDSFEFFQNSFLPKIFLPDLMAVSSWDANTKTLLYNEALYNIEENRWVGGVVPPNKTPSIQSAHGLFRGKHLTIKRDNATGFLNISIKHQSPYIAKAWLDTVVFAINETLREDQKKRALLSIEYLNKQIATTSYTEIKQGLSELIQQETEKLMLIEANEDYIFKMIDPPIVSEFTSEPNRSAIETLGIIIGALLGVLIAYLRYFLIKDITFNPLRFIAELIKDGRERFNLR